MNVTFLGTGYVGLVTGTCFAEVGHDVTCVDIDQHKIDGLNQGKLPIYEAGLDEMVTANRTRDRLDFTTNLADALSRSEVIFIAVGTPQREDGSANLEYVWTAIDQIRKTATSSKTVVIKSTVPVGTNRRACHRLNEGNDIQHSVASNPEFLREGLAVNDALNPDRVVIGVHDDRSRQLLESLYAPFVSQGVPIVSMDWESAEMTKYVANCMLATKISYINEMANMCEAVGADINNVRQGIGYDKRIGFQFLMPGVGYGGSCFPKDVRAMKSMAREKKRAMRILEAVDYVNEEQKRVAFQMLNDRLGGDLSKQQIGVWGLAFKPETDDVREAPSLVLIHQLLDAGARVRVYDPQAMPNVRDLLGERVVYCEHAEQAAKGSDAVVIMTEWKEFQHVELGRLRQVMQGNLIVDGRNIFAPEQMSEAGFLYKSIGRQVSDPGPTPEQDSHQAELLGQAHLQEHGFALRNDP